MTHDTTLLELLTNGRRAVTDAAGVQRGQLAFYNRAWWIQPTPNTLAAQLLYAAIPAYGRYLKLFGGRPKGTLPNHDSYGYMGLGMLLFRGQIIRRLRPA